MQFKEYEKMHVVLYQQDKSTLAHMIHMHTVCM